MKQLKLSDIKELFLTKLLQRKSKCSKSLNEAIHYALNGPGKRIRPLLVLASALSSQKRSIQSSLNYAMPAALSVEYIHTYSLIHDDLPCMDDDDYRRGRPSLHRRFDEATAILAGDALIADAFYLIAKAPLNPAELCAELALAAGSSGLVCGQCEDLKATIATTEAPWLSIHAQKTARLFEACSILGAQSQGLSATELTPYRTFGHHFGMAFQLKDDIDDKAGLFRILASSDIDRRMSLHMSAMHEALGDIRRPELLNEMIGYL
jgi:geranylgeranyl pyrophosphate synthase